MTTADLTTLLPAFGAVGGAFLAVLKWIDSREEAAAKAARAECATVRLQRKRALVVIAAEREQYTSRAHLTSLNRVAAALETEPEPKP